MRLGLRSILIWFLGATLTVGSPAHAFDLGACLYVLTHLSIIRKTKAANRVKPDGVLFVQLKNLVDDSPRRRMVVPVSKLRFLHPMNYEFGKGVAIRRAQKLASVKDEILDSRLITISWLQRLVPSTFPMSAIEMPDGTFVVKNGNSRLFAIFQAFSDVPGLELEIMVHQLFEPSAAQELVERIRLGNQAL